MARADSSVIISRFRHRVNPFFNLFLTLFEPFSSESGFSRDKAAFFLDIAGKMRSLSLLRLIEKFAEIHRQVSLRSLTAVGLGVPTCLFRLKPVSIAECSAFCSETTSPFFEMGLRWAAAQTPAGNIVPCTLSPLRGEVKQEIRKSPIHSFHTVSA